MAAGVMGGRKGRRARESCSTRAGREAREAKTGLADCHTSVASGNLGQGYQPTTYYPAVNLSLTTAV